MSEIKALEKLRNIHERGCGCSDECYSCVVGLHIGEIADEIQAEVDSRYMELPLDADGVPIHRHDELWEVDSGKHIDGQNVYGVSDKYVYIWQEGPKTARGISGYFATNYTHVKPRTVEDVMSEYAELSASIDVKKYHELSDELREMQREQFRDEPERELFKELNGYEFYIELPYDELCIGTDKAWINHHSYSYMYKRPDGGSVYSCSSLCGYSRDWAIDRINEEIARIESELQMRGDAE